MRPRRPLIAVAAVLAACALAAAGCSTGGGDAAGATGSPQSRPVNGTLADVPSVYDRLEPSVVTVLVRKGAEAVEGSGVVWADHLVITNDHVVNGAQECRVVLATGERRSARVRAVDPRTDLAVLTVSGGALPPARFATGLPAVGQLAVAIGNPLGFENSVTAGVISGVERSIPSGGRTPSLVGLLQTDAPISPGNSGGALADADGDVVGINVAYIPPEAQAVAIGFAIPATVVRQVVPELLATGHADHPYLGVVLRPLGPATAQIFGTAGSGVAVVEVDPGGPAGDAGMKPGDIIVGIGGQPVGEIEDVYSALRSRSPGDRVVVEVKRGNRTLSFDVKLGERPLG